MRKAIAGIAGLLVLAGCVNSSTMRTAQNEAIISASAAPVCGGAGAARAAQKQAAIETLRAGYDRYMIVGADRENTVRATELPGSYTTYGTVNRYGNYANFNAQTTYQPGPIIVSGRHNQDIAIHMFRDGEPGAANAISAREVLGPDWAEQVKHNVVTCG